MSQTFPKPIVDPKLQEAMKGGVTQDYERLRDQLDRAIEQALTTEQELPGNGEFVPNRMFKHIVSLASVQEGIINKLWMLRHHEATCIDGGPEHSTASNIHRLWRGDNNGDNYNGE